MTSLFSLVGPYPTGIVRLVLKEMFSAIIRSIRVTAAVLSSKSSPCATACSMTVEMSLMMVAGEASADVYGAQLVTQLKMQRSNLVIWGVGGDAMVAAGFEADVQARELATAGLTEVLGALPRIYGILRKLRRLAQQRRPRVAVLMDLPDFNLRLAPHLKNLGVTVIYYISPQLWAWRSGRVRHIRRWVDRMLCILPFEPEFYHQHGVPAEYVGHPMLNETPTDLDSSKARQALALAPHHEPVVALLPGSRTKEIQRHFPLMVDSVAMLVQRFPQLKVLVPMANTVDSALFRQAIEGKNLPIELIEGSASQVLIAADAAVVCSGTATLQSAFLLKPMVVVYRVSWLTYWLLKAFVKVAHIALVNIVAKRPLVRELVQSQMTATSITHEVESLLAKPEVANKLREELGTIRHQFGEHNPAQRVAQIVDSYLVDGKAET
jgi:lipid-A-disaccharide synthase